MKRKVFALMIAMMLVFGISATALAADATETVVENDSQRFVIQLTNDSDEETNTTTKGLSFQDTVTNVSFGIISAAQEITDTWNGFNATEKIGSISFYVQNQATKIIQTIDYDMIVADVSPLVTLAK